jgi:hypothetical protein
MSTIKTNAILDASGGETATVNGYTPTLSNMPGYNRIINGDMRIDQRNAGASVTPTNGSYTLDRWSCYLSGGGAYSVQQSSTAPTGFVNSLLVTTTTADSSIAAGDYYILTYIIEGTNVADLAWGSASAKTVTLSFWVRSSLTGTFSGSLENSAGNRSYPFTYTISAANTYEYKTVTIAGDTTGTWLTTTGSGIKLRLSLGMGSTYSGTAGAWAASGYYAASSETAKVISTLSATLYITGVQLEVGSVATPFERRDYGRELIMCQRYYYKIKATATDQEFGSGWNDSTTLSSCVIPLPVTMRVAPTALEQSGTASHYQIIYANNAGTCTSVPTFASGSPFSTRTNFYITSGLTAGQGSGARSTSSSAFLAWSAEL